MLRLDRTNGTEIRGVPSEFLADGAVNGVLPAAAYQYDEEQRPMSALGAKLAVSSFTR